MKKLIAVLISSAAIAAVVSISSVDAGYTHPTTTTATTHPAYTTTTQPNNTTTTCPDCTPGTVIFTTTTTTTVPVTTPQTVATTTTSTTEVATSTTNQTTTSSLVETTTTTLLPPSTTSTTTTTIPTTTSTSSTTLPETSSTTTSTSTSTTTSSSTSTTTSTTLPETFTFGAALSVCDAEVPKIVITFQNQFPSLAGVTGTLTMSDINGNVLSSQPLVYQPGTTVSLLYPGTAVNPDGSIADVPGWILNSAGFWVLDPSDAFLREGINLSYTVNPTATAFVTYPPESSACANPNGPFPPTRLVLPVTR